MSDYSFCSFKNVVAKQTAMGKWEYLACHNELTHLPNRRMLNLLMESYLPFSQTTNKKLAFLFMDIDGLKSINDVYGHVKGDLFLKEVANRLAELSSEGIHAFHLSGDEFILLIERAESIDKPIQLIDSIFNSPFKFENHHFFAGASMGISFYPDHSTKLEELIDYADKAMYVAKSSFEKRYCIFHPYMIGR